MTTINIKSSNRLIIGFWILLLLLSLVQAYLIDRQMKAFSHERAALTKEAEFLELGNRYYKSINYLTNEARKYIITYHKDNVDHYFQERNVVNIKGYIESRIPVLRATKFENNLLNNAHRSAENIMELELKAMKLVASAKEHKTIFDKIDIALTNDVLKLSQEAKMTLAKKWMFGDEHENLLKATMISILQFQIASQERMTREAMHAVDDTTKNLIYLAVLTAFIVATLICLVGFRQFLLPKP